jgi:polysaccharide pyruvyl transferase WcaK-like protein
MAAPIRIGLLWHSASSGNLGVGALTLANMAIARGAAAEVGLDPSFLIIGMRDGQAAYVREADVHSFVIDTRSLISPVGYSSALGGVDCLLDIGAGDSFAEIYGPKRFAFFWATKMIALVRRVPLLLSPQTIGPFTRQPYRGLAASAMERAQMVVARDAKSLEVAREIAPAARTMLAVDVAFALPFEDRSAERGEEKLRVGVNASGLLFSDAEAGRNRFNLGFDYAALTRRLLAELTARDDVEVHLITHVASPNIPEDDDGQLAERLAVEFPAVISVPTFAGPSEAKSYISSLDFLVAARMHACIAAFSSGVPVVPISYSRKFSGLFGMLGYERMVPAQGVDTDGALDIIRGGLEQRQLLEEEIGRGMAKVDALLDGYRAELRRFFTEAAARR